MGIIKKADSIFRYSIRVSPNLLTLLFLTYLCLISLTGCRTLEKTPETPVKEMPLVKLMPKDYPKFFDDMFYDGLDLAIQESILYFKKMPASKAYKLGNDIYTADDMLLSLTGFQAFLKTQPSINELNSFIKKKYALYKSIGSDETGDVLFTGYYEPSLRGSLKKKGKYRFPVFARPNDIFTINLRLFSDDDAFKRTLIARCTDKKSVVPYYTRKEIGTGEVLKDSAKVLAYVDNVIDLFFLEIQGSGIIYLDNGSHLRVHYHAKNGHAYKSIGAYLIRNKGVPREEMSMQRIRQYLNEHPDEVNEILNYNTSYVFFKTEDGGPYGCYSAVVTPGRSIATDKRKFPACGLAFISTEKPVIDGDAAISSWVPFGRFVLNQDTGGAIKGPGRADIFKGNGEYAEIAAGHMQHRGDMYFLVLQKN